MTKLWCRQRRAVLKRVLRVRHHHHLSAAEQDLLKSALLLQKRRRQKGMRYKARCIAFCFALLWNGWQRFITLFSLSLSLLFGEWVGGWVGDCCLHANKRCKVQYTHGYAVGGFVQSVHHHHHMNSEQNGTGQDRAGQHSVIQSDIQTKERKKRTLTSEWPDVWPRGSLALLAPRGHRHKQHKQHKGSSRRPRRVCSWYCVTCN